jgi:DNA invertase Pin-like site-specific DNA recombinase
MHAKPHRYVAYYRVSTQKQGNSGLGLEAQQLAVANFLRGNSPVDVFTEIESGRNPERPKLKQAIARCRELKAKLLIAKLDRLARSVAFISNLMESDVEFTVADFPEANRLTIHILAAVAEHEARLISERTRNALAQAKQRGTKLGSHSHKNKKHVSDLHKARASRTQKARQRAIQLMPFIADARAAGHTSLAAIANKLNDWKQNAPLGGTWTASQVRRICLMCDPQAGH